MKKKGFLEMNKIDTLIAYLFAIQALAKDIHYSVKGEAFYSKHLLADEVYKGIDEQIDALIETCILPYDLPKHITTYWKDAKEIMPNGNTDFIALYDLLTKAIYEFNNIGLNSENAGGSLIGDIAKDLQRKLGLITRQVG